MKNGISQLCNAFLLSLDSSEITYPDHLRIQPVLCSTAHPETSCVGWEPVGKILRSRSSCNSPLTGTWQFRQAGTDEWLPANVPGGVHTDLLAAGRIPDPFVADNEKHVQWVAESDWEYRTSFTCHAELLAEEKIFLVCDGLDTLATVVLNGHELGIRTTCSASINGRSNQF